MRREPIISTTLLGRSVSNQQKCRILKPGEMASLSNTNGTSSIVRVQTADTDAVMAWKNNRFHFNHTDIPAIMRQLARWYDVTSSMKELCQPGHFNGKPSRNLSASQKMIRALLQHIGVYCRIEKAGK